MDEHFIYHGPIFQPMGRITTTTVAYLAISFVIIGIIAAGVYIVPKPYNYLLPVPFAIALFVSIPLMARAMPRMFAIYPDRLVFIRPKGELAFHRHEVAMIRPVRPEEQGEIDFTFRVVSVTDDLSNAVRIVVPAGKDYVFSPPDRKEFLEILARAWGTEVVETEF